MKVYFTASVRGKKDFVVQYEKIFHLLEELGATHLDDTIRSADKELYEGTHGDSVELYNRAIKSIQQADIVILEVSVPSLSMGFVMQRALAIGKPVILLYFKGHVPYFATGIENERLQVVEYSVDSLKELLQASLDYAQDQSDTRFNFFISPSLSHYLDWVSQNLKIPRSVYLRRLIEEDRDRHPEYGEV